MEVGFLLEWNLGEMPLMTDLPDFYDPGVKESFPYLRHEGIPEPDRADSNPDQ